MKRFLVLAIAIVVIGAAFLQPALAQTGLKLVSAKALTDHECNSEEWHFVLTQVDQEESAPGSIKVTWANGDVKLVPLWKYTGKTAHYVTTANLDSVVVSATAYIYQDWAGEFNLSHGPCNDPTSTPTLVPPKRLTLTSICHLGEQGQMRLRNPNPIDVLVTWDIYGTSVLGSVTALANQDTFFWVPWPGTVRIFYKINEVKYSDVKAQNQVECEQPTPTPTATPTGEPSPSPTPVEPSPTPTKTKTPLPPPPEPKGVYVPIRFQGGWGYARLWAGGTEVKDSPQRFVLDSENWPACQFYLPITEPTTITVQVFYDPVPESWRCWPIKFWRGTGPNDFEFTSKVDLVIYPGQKVEILDFQAWHECPPAQ